VSYEYAPEALEVLASHGLQPGPRTRPAVVRGALNDLYRYEIRRLRGRLLTGGIARELYADHVIELRRQYWLLSIPVERWVRDPARLSASSNGGFMADEREGQVDTVLTRSAEIVGSAAGTVVNVASQVAESTASAASSAANAASAAVARTAPARRAVKRAAKRIVKKATRAVKVVARSAKKAAAGKKKKGAAKKKASPQKKKSKSAAKKKGGGKKKR
jgi:hypothetical protein